MILNQAYFTEEFYFAKISFAQHAKEKNIVFPIAKTEISKKSFYFTVKIFISHILQMEYFRFSWFCYRSEQKKRT